MEMNEAEREQEVQAAEYAEVPAEAGETIS